MFDHVTTIAMSEKAHFYCPSCKLEFEFRSRYLRHLQAAGHEAYLQCVKIVEKANTPVFVPPHVQPTHCGSTSPAASPDANSLDIGPFVTVCESCFSK